MLAMVVSGATSTPMGTYLKVVGVLGLAGDLTPEPRALKPLPASPGLVCFELVTRWLHVSMSQTTTLRPRFCTRCRSLSAVPVDRFCPISYF